MPLATPQKQPIGVCALLLNRHKQALLGKRKNGYGEGYYGLPGGHVELGEPLVVAVKREVEEETALQLPHVTYVGAVREYQRERDFFHFIFVVDAGDQIPVLAEPDKCEDWEWLELDAVATSEKLQQEILPGHLAALKLYIEKSSLADLARKP